MYGRRPGRPAGRAAVPADCSERDQGLLNNAASAGLAEPGRGGPSPARRGGPRRGRALPDGPGNRKGRRGRLSTLREDRRWRVAEWVLCAAGVALCLGTFLVMMVTGRLAPLMPVAMVVATILVECSYLCWSRWWGGNQRQPGSRTGRP